MNFNGKKILITGASGFIGSFIVEEALRKGMDVWAAVRKSTNRKYLSDPRINFVELNLASEEQMTEVLKSMEFDYVVHAAGATKCINSDDFYRINTEGTKNLVRALQATVFKEHTEEKMLVYVSSLSIFGAIHEEQPYVDITDKDTPQPNTAYGMSKLKAEEWLHDNCHTPYIILRPTGVYGPREKDYYMMVDSIRQHVDFSVGFKPQVITFVYVSDVVQAVFKAIEHPECSGRAYFLSDGEEYSSRTFSDLIKEELGIKFLLRIKAPLWVLRIVTYFGEIYARSTGKITALNNDKYNILRQRNWKCDISPARRDLGFEPLVKLAEGVKNVVHQ